MVPPEFGAEPLSKLIAFMFFVAALLAGGLLAQAQEEAPPEPQALIDAALDQLQAAESFRMEIEQTGEPYSLALTFDGINTLPASLQQADAQYISPDELHISALLHFFIPLSMDIYSLDDRQWISFPSGAPWFQLPAFEDFDINRLMAPGDGMDYALSNLQQPQIIADDALVDEQPAWLLRARAAGEVVADLFFGFIVPQEDVEVDAYITAEDGRLAMLIITMLETTDDPEHDPSVWHIRFHDYDAPRDFQAPTP